MIDDLLDFLGDSGTTGKKTGNDFIEGKITLPLLYALKRADASARQAIEALIQGDRSQPEAFDSLYALIERFDGFNAAERTAGQLVATAIDALAIFSSSQQERENVALLKELACYILARKK